MNRSGLLVVAALLATGCGIDNALVGGRCAEGFIASGDACVPAESEEAPPATDTNAPPPSTASAPEDDGTREPRDDGRDLTIVGTIGGRGPTELTCSGGEVACRGACIPVDSDGQNCGACGKICPSNICVAGVCQGATPGDVVVIGHDFEHAWVGSAQARVLVNAVSIPSTDPIRVLSFEGDAAPSAVANAKALIGEGVHGRGVRIVATSDPSALESTALARSYDVVLVHDGAGSAPSALGSSWADALSTFTKKGGVVVALDGARSDMPALLSSAELLSIGGHTLLPEGTHLSVTAPADVVGNQVLSPYAAFGSSISFQGTTPDASTTFVVRRESASGDGDPVVIHRVVQ